MELSAKNNDCGRFITVEGLDGAGKTAAIDTISHLAEEAGITLIKTREPGGTPTGELLRSIILSKKNEITPDAEVLLIFAARAQHLSEVILPNLNNGNWVLCDRFTDSTYAYQGGGRNLGFERIQPIEQWVHAGFSPDLTVLLDASVETAKYRSQSVSSPDRIEKEDREFHQSVRQAFVDLHHLHPKRIKLIDAEMSKDEVCTQVRACFEQFIASLNG